MQKFVVLVALVSCATESPPAPEAGDDLPVGDLSPADSKADGNWGHALECKDVPEVTPLVAPHITLSVDGLTLHLTDAASGYDRVFPVGPGAIDATPTDAEFGESLSYAPVIHKGHEFQITPATIQPCKTWWTDPESGQKIPVFAGLPFMSWSGNYAIHGPIDNYRAANGGSLRRGYVSHGCFRMEAADVLEVYGRIKGVAKVPVHVQRERERRTDGSVVDLDAKWIGATCAADADCNFPNGFCAPNAYAPGGTCSAHCTQFCTDRPGAPSTFCVDDPASPGQGMCVAKAVAQDQSCRPYEALSVVTRARHGNPAVTANVCMPGSRGWVGDHCFADGDCTNGTTCLGANGVVPGVCSSSCQTYCSDQPGWADTFCAAGGSCLRQCTPSSNGSECPGDMTCGSASRNGQPSATRNVCLPR